jgi:hypothetical protein
MKGKDTAITGQEGNGMPYSSVGIVAKQRARKPKV